MSNPDQNPNFHRRWDTPPPKPKALPVDGTTRQGERSGNGSSIEVAKVFEKFKDHREVIR